MSIANKYRPSNFNEVLGNSDNIEILNNYIDNENHPHSYLFYGNHGCGKTTLARILCSKFNCELKELNTSDDRGIQSIRNGIIKDSSYGTFSGKNKGYLLDECHKLTNEAQNALLKILEEPPKNVYIFLCTTEPNKLLKTIISRCEKFGVETIGSKILYPYLIYISKKENKEISKKVARRIAESSDGHIRDALKILEKVLTTSDENKQLKLAGEKIEENEQTIDLCRKLLGDEWDEVINVLKDLQKENPESIRKIILTYMQKALLNGNKQAIMVITAIEEPVYDFAVLCARLYQIFV